MNTEILSHLRTRLATGSRSLSELHQAAHAAGSAWSIDQVGLLLDCLPDVVHDGDAYGIAAREGGDPLTRALLSVATPTPIPAAALVTRLPKGVVASAAALCELARHHPDLELLPGNRIRRR